MVLGPASCLRIAARTRNADLRTRQKPAGTLFLSAAWSAQLEQRLAAPVEAPFIRSASGYFAFFRCDMANRRANRAGRLFMGSELIGVRESEWRDEVVFTVGQQQQQQHFCYRFEARSISHAYPHFEVMYTYGQIRGSFQNNLRNSFC